MKKDDRLTIFLSPGELFWIASYLGYTSLPFLGSPLKNRTSDQVKELLTKGFETLEMRNLIQDQGKNLQVDPFMENLVQMIAVPEFTLIVSSIRKEEAPIQLFLYSKDQQSISVTQKDRYYNLGLFRESAALERNLTGWLCIGSQTSEKNPPFRLPACDLIKLMSDIWKNPALVNETLQKAGLAPGNSTDLTEILSTITGVSVLTRVDWESGAPAKTGQLVILSNSASLWINETTDQNSNQIELSPENSILVGKVIRKYTQTTFKINAESQENTL
ncbi:MAG TPA: hypothetical protein VMS73_05300 [Anaerolineaceae bacterium]|nr:hypothetical protein [Anaerolineaceae bacterium]